jgi:hypothetical protein
LPHEALKIATGRAEVASASEEHDDYAVTCASLAKRVPPLLPWFFSTTWWTQRERLVPSRPLTVSRKPAGPRHALA